MYTDIVISPQRDAYGKWFGNGLGVGRFYKKYWLGDSNCMLHEASNDACWNNKEYDSGYFKVYVKGDRDV